MHFTYVLYSHTKEQFYKGSTQDIEDRLRRHQAGYEKATKSGIPWILLWTDEKPSKSEAQKLEYKLKNLSRKRLIDFMMKYKQGVAGPDELQLLLQLSGC